MIEFNRLFTITMPKGELSETGIREINKLITVQRLDQAEWQNANPGRAGYYLPGLPDEWLWVWLVKRGDYAGTMPKRVANYYFKTHNLRCPSAFISQIGNIARAHSGGKITYNFDFDKDIDWQDGDFGDDGSCLWGDHAGALEMLRENSGFAIRFFNEFGDGQGRAWMYDNGKFYVLWNGYGFTHDATLQSARIFATWAGLSYERISLTNYSESSGVLYINGGRGYIIGSVADITGIPTFDFHWENIYNYTCEACGRSVDEDERYTSNGGYDYCDSCYHDLFTTCEHCSREYDRESDSITWIEHVWGDVCDNCLNRFYARCEKCEEYRPKEDVDSTGHCDNCREPIEE